MTRAELLARWRTRADDAERIKASAPVAEVYRAVLAELEEVSGMATPRGPDTFLTLAEAAERLRVDVRWLSEARPDGQPLPFLRKITRRTVRVSEHGLARWMETRPPE